MVPVKPVFLNTGTKIRKTDPQSYERWYDESNQIKFMWKNQIALQNRSGRSALNEIQSAATNRVLKSGVDLITRLDAVLHAESEKNVCRSIRKT